MATTQAILLTATTWLLCALPTPLQEGADPPRLQDLDVDASRLVAHGALDYDLLPVWGGSSAPIGTARLETRIEDGRLQIHDRWDLTVDGKDSFFEVKTDGPLEGWLVPESALVRNSADSLRGLLERDVRFEGGVVRYEPTSTTTEGEHARELHGLRELIAADLPEVTLVSHACWRLLPLLPIEEGESVRVAGLFEPGEHDARVRDAHHPGAHRAGSGGQRERCRASLQHVARGRGGGA